MREGEAIKDFTYPDRIVVGTDNDKAKEIMTQIYDGIARVNKPILFTEYGFQSVNGAAGRHWEVDKSENNVNEELQANAYEATFRVFENETWYVGGFFWKWHFNSRQGRWRGTEWTPQNKPAEQVITRWYSKMD